MGFVEDIENKVRDYLEGDYEVEDTASIPSVEDVPFGKVAKKMDLCVFCIDLRKSSELLSVHKKQTCGKIHKAFLTVVTGVVLAYRGQIRSFNGDSLLAFWPAVYKSDISRAVKAAMVTKWLLDIKLSPIFETYEKIDFGIGVDWGETYIVRAGISRNANNNDLVFIGKCVNFSTAIAQQARSPRHVEISNDTYNNLTEDLIYGKKKNGEKVDMWTDSSIKWKEKSYKTKATSWYFF